MLGNTVQNNSIRYDKILAKLFLFFIPFSIFSPLAFLKNIFVGIAGRASFLFLLIALVLYVVENGKISIEMDEGGLIFRHFAIIYIVGGATSLFMALVLRGELGTIGGESTIEATLKKIIISVALVAVFFYTREVFHILTRKEIEKVFDHLIIACIAVGLLQIGVLRVGGAFKTVYDLINRIFGAWTSAAITNTGRIALLTSEPAAIAGFFGVALFPYIYSKWLHYGLTISDFIKLVFLIYIMYHTNSTTGYALFCIDTVAFIFLYLKKPGVSQQRKAAGFLFMVGMIVLFFYFIVGHEAIGSNISTVFDKLFNADNTSSQIRKIGLQVNWNIFRLFPIAGVGNGDQGFYYQQFFPKDALTTPWALERYNQAANQLMDGGVYFASFMSGYGIIGILFMVTFIVRGARLITRERGRFGSFYYFYLIAIVSLIVYGFSSTLIGDFSTWFIFGLPMAASFWQTDETETLPIHTSKYIRS